MAYNKFTLSKAKETFQLQTDEKTDLFSTVEEVKISDWLAATLKKGVPLALAINTEKAKSEMIIAPILIEFQNLAESPVSLFSGILFNVDREKGLTGRCDFIVSRSTEQYFITAPVITIVEAKNDNLKSGIGQCVAEMFGAKLFNKREGNDISTIYGAVTTGSSWNFLKLVGETVYIDVKEYYLVNVGKILGILLSMVQ